MLQELNMGRGSEVQASNSSNPQQQQQNNPHPGLNDSVQSLRVLANLPTTMKSEAERLLTFAQWLHNDKVEASKIAKAGFFYTGKYAEVKCFWCGCVLSQWDYGDQVMARHRSESPDCPFILNRSDNVPLISNEQNSPQQITSQSSQQQSQNQNADQEEETSTDEHDTSMDTTGPVENHDPGPSQPPAASSSTPNSIDYPRVAAPQPPQPTPLPSNHRDRVENLSDFKSEAARLTTYQGWPLRNQTPADLANAGFVYTGRNDIVRCVFCSEYVGNWDPEDSPITEHRKLFPHCPFVRGLEVGNIPISRPPQRSRQSHDSPRAPFAAQASMAAADVVGGYDVCGIRRGIRDANSGPEKGNGILNVNQETARRTEEIGIIRHSGPAHQKYSTVDARLRSFRDWPPALKQRPTDLAEAGFYYIGLSDQVKCFYCDGGLRNWQPEDDPWTEHSRWFSKCGFVRLVKGDEFIAKSIQEKPTEPQEAMSEPSDADINRMMSTPIVQQVLAMGIEPSRIRSALKKKYQETGSGFGSPDELVQGCLSLQNQNEPNASAPPSQESHPVFSNHIPSQPSSAESRQSLNTASATATSTTAPDPAEQQRSSSAPGSVIGAPDDSEAKASIPKHDDDLESENRMLKEQRTCKICMDKEIGVVFLPCGHLICCVQCAPALKDCPLCRQPIHGTVKTYMS